MAGLTGQWEQALSEEFTKEYYKNYFFSSKKNFQARQYTRRRPIFLMRFI